MLEFENKLPSVNRDAIIDKINSVSNYLGIDPNWLMSVIRIESNFNLQAQNNFTNATGIIQFTRDHKGVDYKTIEGQRYYMGAIKLMSWVEQLELARKYYTPYKNKINNVTDLYLTTFFPIAVGKQNSWILQAPGIPKEAIASANPPFDPQGKGYVTVADIKTKLMQIIPSQYFKEIISNPSVKKSAYGIAALGLIGTIIYLLNTK